jgi:hypothetical protein
LNGVGVQEAMLVEFVCAKRDAVGRREERIGVVRRCALRVAAEERGNCGERQRQWCEARTEAQQNACETDPQAHNRRCCRFETRDARYRI